MKVEMKAWFETNLKYIFGAVAFVVLVLLIVFTNQRTNSKIDNLDGRLGKVESWTKKAANFMNSFDGRLGKLEQDYAKSATAVAEIIHNEIELGQINEYVSQLEAQRDAFAKIQSGVTGGIGSDVLADALKNNAEEAKKLDALREERCRALLSPTMSDAEKDYHCKKGVSAPAPRRAANNAVLAHPANIVVNPIGGGTWIGQFDRNSVDEIQVAPASRVEQTERVLIITPPAGEVASAPAVADEDFDVEVIPAPPVE
jgi:uncharacterized protein YoxC